ncbi:MAG: NnrU family protein [Alphaproteobacteria bacterium]
MTEFLTALAVFLAAHLVPAIPLVRRRLVRTLGEKTYLASYSALSMILLVWVIVALLRAPYIHLWTPAPEAYRVTVVLMAPAFVLVTAGLLEANPLSVSMSTAKFDPERPGIGGVTRHPVLWGFGLWAATHAAVNGALAPVVLFGGMTLLSLGGMAMVDAKRRKQLGAEDWRRLAGPMPVVPFRAVFKWRAEQILTPRTLAGTAAGLGLYFLFLFWAHRAWFGYDPLGTLA